MIFHKFSDFLFFVQTEIDLLQIDDERPDQSADSILPKIKRNYSLISNYKGFLMQATFEAFFSSERYIFLRLSNFNGSSNKMAELLILV